MKKLLILFVSMVLFIGCKERIEVRINTKHGLTVTARHYYLPPFSDNEYYVITLLGGKDSAQHFFVDEALNEIYEIGFDCPIEIEYIGKTKQEIYKHKKKGQKYWKVNWLMGTFVYMSSGSEKIYAEEIKPEYRNKLFGDRINVFLQRRTDGKVFIDEEVQRWLI